MSSWEGGKSENQLREHRRLCESLQWFIAKKYQMPGSIQVKMRLTLGNLQSCAEILMKIT